MVSLTTMPSRVLRSPTAYPFAFFFAFGLAAARAALAGLAAFALAGLAFLVALGAAGTAVAVATGAAAAATAAGAPPRSRMIVKARARSRRAMPMRAGFLATPIVSWKRRLKISS